MAGWTCRLDFLPSFLYCLYQNTKYILSSDMFRFLFKEVSISVVISSLRMTRLLLKANLTRSELFTKGGSYVSYYDTSLGKSNSLLLSTLPP